MKRSTAGLREHFNHLGVVLKPNNLPEERGGLLNPGCTRLRDESLVLYPRMVARGNISRIGSFRAQELPNGKLSLQNCGYALQPEASYELRDQPDGYGCEDPRVTFIRALELYVMAYVAFGPQGPKVAVAVSGDGLSWKRLGLMRFFGNDKHFSDKDAAFFPEPLASPKGHLSLALYHRPSPPWPTLGAHASPTELPGGHEGISIGYVRLEPVRSDLSKLCDVSETHQLELPPADWGRVKVGAGTPPVRIDQGWMAVIHGVDVVPLEDGSPSQCYRGGVIIHDAEDISRVVYRSPSHVFVPEPKERSNARIRRIVFPTGIDRRRDINGNTFDVYYGMGDYEIGRGRLTLA